MVRETTTTNHRSGLAVDEVLLYNHLEATIPWTGRQHKPVSMVLDDPGTILFIWPGNSIQEYFFADDNPHVGGEWGSWLEGGPEG